MSDPILPIPATRPEPDCSTSGEGAQTALAAMIRKRRMGEKHVHDEPVDARPKPAL